MVRRLANVETFCGGVAQLGERSVRNAEVVGSSPITSNKSLCSKELGEKEAA